MSLKSKLLLTFSIGFFCFTQSKAATYYSVANGNWTGAIWSSSCTTCAGSTLPTLVAGDIVIIDDQVTISSGTLTISVAITINLVTNSATIAKLIFTTGGKLALTNAASVINLSNTTGNASLNPVIDGTGSGGSNQIAIGGNEVWRASNGDIAGIGQLNQNSSSGSLPIELIAFSANRDNKFIVLNWSTASQLNFDYFSVQHSIDGLEWTELSQVQGAGTTNEMLAYSFEHESPVIGKNYYRLKSVDFDLTYEYSPIVSVTVEMQKEFSVYPNPAVSADVVMYESNFVPQENDMIAVYDVIGFKVAQVKLTSTKSTVGLSSSLKSGTYLIKCSSGNQVFTKRIVIE
jgi:Secretion system C-terminal sorting domain